jgi:predicted transcriptional regulator
MTPEMAAAIKRMRAEGLYVQQIAAELHINQGRVSEVMSGKRFKDQPPANDDQIPFDFG